MHQNHKLVAAEASHTDALRMAHHQVSSTERCGEAIRHFDQKLIARQVPEAVVDVFEPVQIDKQDAGPRAGPVGGFDGQRKMLEEVEPVGKAGQ